MDESVYKVHYYLERFNWWNLARKEIIFQMLEEFHPNLKNAKALDIGTGTGSFVEDFEKRGIAAEGHDNTELALDFVRQSCPKSKAVKKSFPEDYRGDVEHQFDVVLLCDILEHVEKDADALAVALRHVKPGGILLVTVPACKAMWSGYDVMAHHFRRYHMDEMEALIKTAGVTPKKVSHFSTLLFPFMFMVRFLEARFLDKKKSETEYRPHIMPSVINQIFLFIFRMEKFLLKHFNLPYGSSIVAVLQKDDGQQKVEAKAETAKAIRSS